MSRNRHIADGTLTSGTAQTADGSSGSITFSDIPAWAKRITLIGTGVSTSAVAAPYVRLGTSGGIVATGYHGGQGYSTSGGACSAGAQTIGLSTGGTAAGTDTKEFVATIINLDGDEWLIQTQVMNDGTNTNVYTGVSGIDLGATLTQVAIQVDSGTLDAGTINIIVE